MWDAIGEALHAGVPLPQWTVGYLRSVAACLAHRRYHDRPLSSQITSAMASAVLDPRGELDRMDFEAARRDLAQKRRAAQGAPTSTALRREIRALERVIAALRPRLKPRRTGRTANPFSAGDRERHAILMAMDVWDVLTTDWSRDHAARATPTATIYRRAARQHPMTCDMCQRQPDWRATQRAWLAYKDNVIPPTVRAKK
jgi:hypothetical protein